MCLYCEFQNGKHVVTRSSHSSFNSVWSELGLEQSIVKYSKYKQGLSLVSVASQKPN